MNCFNLKSALLRALLATALTQTLPAMAADGPTVVAQSSGPAPTIISPGLGTLGLPIWWLRLLA